MPFLSDSFFLNSHAYCKYDIVASSLIIPSALALLLNLFPEPTEQAYAIGIFSNSRPIGTGEHFVYQFNWRAFICTPAIGLLVGAVIVQFTDWPWIFWSVAPVALPISGICMLLILDVTKAEEGGVPQRESSWRSLDPFGVSVLTGTLK